MNMCQITPPRMAQDTTLSRKHFTADILKTGDGSANGERRVSLWNGLLETLPKKPPFSLCLPSLFRGDRVENISLGGYAILLVVCIFLCSPVPR